MITTTLRIVLVAASVAFAACAGGDPTTSPSCPIPPDSADGTVTLPAWKLKDVQPASPRAGQTYGLDTFSGKIVVVTLVEGF